MRKSQIKGICHDVLDLLSYQNPMEYHRISGKYFINLLSGGMSDQEDSLSEILKKKRKWFLDRIKSLKGDLKDFQEAKITAQIGIEKIEIIYKGEKFSDSKDYRTILDSQESFGKAMKKLRKEIKKDKIKK